MVMHSGDRCCKRLSTKPDLNGVTYHYSKTSRKEMNFRQLDEMCKFCGWSLPALHSNKKNKFEDRFDE